MVRMLTDIEAIISQIRKAGKIFLNILFEESEELSRP